MTWSSKFAYVIGIIAADGYVSKNGRHISITSKDQQILENCKQGLEINNQITKKSRAAGEEKKYFVLQFGSVDFHKFLCSIGITNAKSKTISSVEVPEKFYIDFLRGCIDGDGSITVYQHKESKLPQLKLRLVSASPSFLRFVKETNTTIMNIQGGWTYRSKNSSVSELVYGKTDAIKILNFVYNTDCNLRLDRKYQIAKRFIA